MTYRSANQNDPFAPHRDHVLRAAKQVLANYDEFGVEGGLDEYMDGLRKAIESASENGYGVNLCPSCAHGGLPQRLRHINPGAPAGVAPQYVCADCGGDGERPMSRENKDG